MKVHYLKLEVLYGGGNLLKMQRGPFSSKDHLDYN